METFGQKVRQAVESQGLPLDKVAAATGLGVEHIKALERDDFGALPSDELVREGLRSFARLLDVDPDQVLADYSRARHGWLEAAPSKVEVVGARDAPDDALTIESPRQAREEFVVEPPRPRPARRGRRVALLASAILALAVVALLFWSRPPTAPESRRLAVARDTPPKRETAEEKRDSLAATAGGVMFPPQRPLPPADSMEQASALEQPVDPSELSIRQHGVGRGVVNRELVGEADRFAAGERVWFWTLIEGGAAGESIDHVWLHEGVETLRVPLRLGGARWRTQSHKDLSPGSEGAWAVEAQDPAGRVLARREFLCSPRLQSPGADQRR